MTHVTINYRLFARFTRDAVRVLFFFLWCSNFIR